MDRKRLLHGWELVEVPVQLVMTLWWELLRVELEVRTIRIDGLFAKLLHNLPDDFQLLGFQTVDSLVKVVHACDAR